MGRPLNFMASQAMHFMSPGVLALARQRTFDHYRQFAAFLERRGATDYLARRIEHFERLCEQQEKGTGPTAPESHPEPHDDN